MKANLSNPDATFVGQGLEERTYEDCLQQRLNPNGNAAGAIMLPRDTDQMEKHVRNSQSWGLKALKRTFP